MVANTVPAPPEAEDSTLNSHLRLDKAVLAMALARLAKKPGESGKGANRDDHPLFQQIAEAWVAGNSVDKDLRLAAHYRVRKYKGQLQRDGWMAAILDDKKPRDAYYEPLKEFIGKKKADDELRELIQQHKQENGYGNW